MIDIWPSPAKLNLFLYINNRRSDGYHNVQTIFQFLDYGDLLQIKINNSGNIELTTQFNDIPKENNLIIKAANLLKKTAKNILPLNAGAIIHINKKLPIGSGLGGGSSNAATILVALNYLWKIRLTINELAKLSLQLGADIPIFIYGLASFAQGKGEKIIPINFKEKWYLITYPNIKISTKEVFNYSNLTRNTKHRSLHTLLNLPFTNDCENIVRSNFNKVDEIINLLMKYAPTRLTGTGSCVFSEFDNKKNAYDTLNLLPKYATGFIAKGINISPLRQVLLMNNLLRN
ncbi:4-(cytidine 5'-diphospho)-2-C-methyl-D-erythritol kinase [Candidatus Pantoea edessiphila]|uniref:4-diphosphocytidyl-2-C-methyl-D-erythritol kinase n=1 Tax=Candidatus Pantoea edessiphila TaxID=2044610 RepID=A0A2P5T0L3_9GAMM|nr:4-(cytidine 5'-diphospho)-2-C-methyl-D-erythritol kinase [Candidatus Pantoea edessiphila]PPI88121.1 4-(cytidine 5'-diphospho)-2-C-methyl-D-erythritol kinase [Candidatus Pantoea edessiphila]